MTDHAAFIQGEAIPKTRVDTLVEALTQPPRRGARNGATSHDEPATARRHTAALTADRQRRRWATQVVVIDELARRACTDRGLNPPEEPAMPRPLTLAEPTVADLGSIVAAALAHSPAARLLLTELEAEQDVPETVVRDYYDRNRDRFLTPEALRRGADPFHEHEPTDVLPYERVRDGITRELRRAAGRRAFFDWLDRARADVVYAAGHEHPGDPSHQDHEHRH